MIGLVTNLGIHDSLAGGRSWKSLGLLEAEGIRFYFPHSTDRPLSLLHKETHLFDKRIRSTIDRFLPDKASFIERIECFDR